MANSLVFEDFVEGDHWVSDEEYEVTSDEIVSFASTWDPQPFHINRDGDPGLTQGLCASGWHTAAITSKLFTGMGLLGAVGAGVSLTWPTPTRPGDFLHIELTVTSARRSQSKPDRGVVTVDYVTLTRDGAVRQRSTATIIVRSGAPEE